MKHLTHIRDSLLVDLSDGIAVHSEVRPETKVMELGS
jgi:hypothetical protein